MSFAQDSSAGMKRRMERHKRRLAVEPNQLESRDGGQFVDSVKRDVYERQASEGLGAGGNNVPNRPNAEDDDPFDFGDIFGAGDDTSSSSSSSSRAVSTSTRNTSTRPSLTDIFGDDETTTTSSRSTTSSSSSTRTTPTSTSTTPTTTSTSTSTTSTSTRTTSSVRTTSSEERTTEEEQMVGDRVYPLVPLSTSGLEPTPHPCHALSEAVRIRASRCLSSWPR